MYCMLIRRHARRAVTDVAETQWRTEVSAQLATLQTGLAALQTEGEKQRQESWRVWLWAILVLCGSGLLVVIGIHLGLAAVTEAATAGRLQSQVASIQKRTERISVPKADQAEIAKCNRLTGDVAFLDCVAKINPTIAKNIATEVAKGAGAQLNRDVAGQFQLWGPAVLAFGSALSGAVLGWMLTQWFAYLKRQEADVDM
jgi:hypothetical protein